MDQLYTLIWISLQILGTDENVVEKAFAWLDAEADEGNRVAIPGMREDGHHPPPRAATTPGSTGRGATFRRGASCEWSLVGSCTT